MSKMLRGMISRNPDKEVYVEIKGELYKSKTIKLSQSKIILVVTKEDKC